MASFLEFYREGGLWMHPITLWTLVAAAVVVRQALRPAKDLMPLARAALGLAFGFGVLGVVVGLIEGFSAIAVAPLEQRERLVNISLAIGFNPLALALMGALFVGCFAVPVWWLTRERHLLAATTP